MYQLNEQASQDNEIELNDLYMKYREKLLTHSLRFFLGLHEN